MRFQVTQDHIDRGIKADNKSCPVALSILESDKGIHTALVGDDEIIIVMADETEDGGYLTTGHIFSTADSLHLEIRAFDQDRTMQPGELVLDWREFVAGYVPQR